MGLRDKRECLVCVWWNYQVAKDGYCMCCESKKFGQMTLGWHACPYFVLEIKGDNKRGK